MVFPRTIFKAAALVALIAVAGAFWLGRTTAKAPANEAHAFDRAFLDPINRYTVRLIQYAESQANLARAHATAKHLRENCGVPVHGPLKVGKSLVLCAGEAPKVADLDPLLKRVRPLPGPPPQERTRPFASAYVVNIDDVVRRD